MENKLTHTDEKKPRRTKEKDAVKEKDEKQQVEEKKPRRTKEKDEKHVDNKSSRTKEKDEEKKPRRTKEKDEEKKPIRTKEKDVKGKEKEKDDEKKPSRTKEKDEEKKPIRTKEKDVKGKEKEKEKEKDDEKKPIRTKEKDVKEKEKEKDDEKKPSLTKEKEREKEKERDDEKKPSRTKEKEREKEKEKDDEDVEYPFLDMSYLINHTKNYDSLKVCLKMTRKGVGLFARTPIKKGNTVAYYKVKVISDRSTKYKKVKDGIYTFSIYTKDDEKIKKYFGDICMESLENPRRGAPFFGYLANEPSNGQSCNVSVDTNLKDNYTDRDEVRPGDFLLYKLVALRDIPENEEICWYYGDHYDRDYEISDRTR